MTNNFGFREDYDRAKRFVKQEYIWYKGKYYFLSTVDLGLAHEWGASDNEEYYWETMLFYKGDFGDLAMDRYTSLKDAIVGHEIFKQRFINGEFEEE